MKMPKVVRTYTKKIKHESPVQKNSSALSLTRYSMREGDLLDGLLDAGPDTLIQQIVSKETPKTKPAKKPTSAVTRKRKRQTLQDGVKVHREDRSEDDAVIVTGEKKRKIKRKKRRAPGNELALVVGLPSQELSAVKTLVRMLLGHHLL